ncbi:helix-turn-helix domain-containing protein [Actinomadura gamaensis]|uniref:Helix-turn-helix domain-containing protein n=1 Tax=Actinomadura gamaensis TaxID=1763541 RepID=A0ABV9UCD1_9ACTN
MVARDAIAPTESSAAAATDCRSPRGMRRVRTRHTSRFTVIPNGLAQHSGLSLRARGLGLLLLSLPDGADISIRALAARLNEGEMAIGRALRELETAGYLSRRVVRLDDGRLVTCTTVRDVPEEIDDELPSDLRGSRATLEAAPGADDAAPNESAPSAGRVGAASRTGRRPAQLASAALTAGTRVLLGVVAAEPRLSVGAATLPALAALVGQALAADVPPAEIHWVLTKGLPSEIRSAAALIRHRLDEQMPVWTAVASLRATASADSACGSRIAPSPAAVRWTECGDCARPLRTATPDGLCGDCRAVLAA